MIDIFALLLVHGLLAIALWRLVGDDRLDREGPAPAQNGRETGDGADGTEGGEKGGGPA